jgi:hypothetical protein
VIGVGTTITINYVYINPNNTLYKGDWLTNYFFGVDMTIYGDIPHEFTLIMYLGKDQNSLVEILRSTITYDTLPPVLYPSFIIEFYGTVFWSYGYRTVDDLLNKAGVSNLTSCVFCVRVIWGSGESSKCTTVTIVQPTPPTVTINNVYLTRDGYTTNNMYRGESLDRYAIYFDVTVGSTTGVSVNIIVRAGKDQNNLKTIGGYGQTLTSGTYVIPMRIFSTIYPTTDDFLNSIGATDSCVICVTIS